MGLTSRREANNRNKVGEKGLQTGFRLSLENMAEDKEFNYTMRENYQKKAYFYQ